MAFEPVKAPWTLFLDFWFPDRRWNAGFRAAQEEIRGYDRGDLTHDNIKQNRLAQTNFRQSLIDDPFWAGLDTGWRQHGAADARRGMCKARKYRQHSYNAGWYNEIIIMQEKGFSHPKLDKEHGRMRRLYWQSDYSDAYYETGRE